MVSLYHPSIDYPNTHPLTAHPKGLITWDNLDQSETSISGNGDL